MTYYLSAIGDDRNNGTSESQAWRTIAAVNARLKPGDNAVFLPGVWTGTLAPPSGTTLRAKELNSVWIDGSNPAGAFGWKANPDGTWSRPDNGAAYGVWLGTFEQQGKRCSVYNRDYAMYDKEYPGLDINLALKAPQYKLSDQNVLRLLTNSGGSPVGELVKIAAQHQGIVLDGRSDVTLLGINVRFCYQAVSTDGGSNLHLADCQFRYLGNTAVWLTKIDGAELDRCVIQGAGSWLAHNDDCIHVEHGRVSISDCDFSYGGHGGLIAYKGGLLGVDGCRSSNHGGSAIQVKPDTGHIAFTLRNSRIGGGAIYEQSEILKADYPAVHLQTTDAVIDNNVLSDSGFGILISSDADTRCLRNTITRNTIERIASHGINLQLAGGPGTIDGTLIQRNILQDCCQAQNRERPPQDYIFAAVTGGKTGVIGAANRIENNYIGGRINLNGALFAPSGASPNLSGNDNTSKTDRGASVTPEPPAPPVDPPDNDPEDPVPTKPRIFALTPSTVKPGEFQTIDGELFGANPLFVMQTRKPSGTISAARVPMSSYGDRQIKVRIPNGEDPAIGVGVSGPCFVRNTALQLSSDPVQLTVSGDTPPQPANKPPVANAGGPYVGIAGQPVQFDGSGSLDGDGTIVRSAWAIPGVIELTGPTPRWTFATPGVYAVTLTVTDDKGATASATANVSISAPVPPPPAIAIVALDFALDGAFSGAVIGAGAKLPAGSTITVTVRTPDQRSATAEARIPSDIPPPVPPPGPTPDAVTNLWPVPAVAGPPPAAPD